MLLAFEVPVLSVSVISTPTEPTIPRCEDDPSVSRDEADRRANLLAAALTLESQRARSWRYAWTVINGVSTVGPLAAMPFVPRADWSSLVAGSITSALSTGFTYFWSLEIEAVENRLSAASGLAPCERLTAVRILAASAAADEVSRRSWPWHIVNFGVSAALGAVIAVGFHHPTAGALSGLSGFVAGEAQLFTQPVHLGHLRLSGMMDASLFTSPAYPVRNFALVGASLEWSLP